MLTRGPLLDAEPCFLSPRTILKSLERKPVVVLPGFVGRTLDGSVSLLGRGGSDLTALFLADRLGAATCRLLKDTDGLYERDPALPGPVPRRYASLSWQDALGIGDEVIQPKAKHYAKRNRLSFEVTSPGAAAVTTVGPGPTCYATAGSNGTRVRVALLGLGTVGLGVYRCLEAQPERFEVVGITVRDPLKHDREGIPSRLLGTDPQDLLGKGSDLVVELLGGLSPAKELMETALDAGRDVVSANKEVLATHGPRLRELAAAKGAFLLSSASVGGSVPVLEAVTRVARQSRVRAIEGVLNGTCNFVLEQLERGKEFAAAVRMAQELGFAEADPTTDLDGSDAAFKLTLLIRAAFGVPFHPDEIRKRGIQNLRSADVGSRTDGKVVRLVASCRQTQSGVRASVKPLCLPARHPLAGTRGEENRVLIHLDGGDVLLLKGKGAGRWPTTEAVMADIFDIYRERRTKDQTARSVRAVREEID